jgi:hypothetical protein
MSSYAFAVVVVVLAAAELARLQPSNRPPAHHHAPGRLATFLVCPNRSNMFIDLCFMSRYAFPAVVVVWSSPIEFWLLGLRLTSAHLLTTMHLVVVASFLYAQIV